MYAHMYGVHMYVHSHRTTMGAPPHLFCFCFETESLTDLNSESLLFLPTKHWDLQACTTKPSFFRWVLGSALGSSCLHGKLFTD